ncbi:MAG: hypothetical protein CK428_32470 [Mycobacterium sp.]|nr:MAG: hypothetical protein CK428_32470 [Mycobacterium sp.]
MRKLPPHSPAAPNTPRPRAAAQAALGSPGHTAARATTAAAARAALLRRTHRAAAEAEAADLAARVAAART